MPLRNITNLCAVVLFFSAVGLSYVCWRQRQRRMEMEQQLTRLEELCMGHPV